MHLRQLASGRSCVPRCTGILQFRMRASWGSTLVGLLRGALPECNYHGVMAHGRGRSRLQLSQQSCSGCTATRISRKIWHCGCIAGSGKAYVLCVLVSVLCSACWLPAFLILCREHLACSSPGLFCTGLLRMCAFQNASVFSVFLLGLYDFWPKSGPKNGTKQDRRNREHSTVNDDLFLQ